MSGVVWNIVLGAMAIIGFALAVWQTVRAEQLARRQRDYSWDRFERVVGELARQVRQSGYQPEVLVAMSDRGAIVAHLLNRELGTDLPVITTPYQQGTAGPALAFPDHLPIGTGYSMLVPTALSTLVARRVLVVDDFVRSGDAAAQLVAVLRTFGFPADAVRTAAPVTSSVAVSTGKAPDFWVDQAQTMTFRFPWGPVR